MVKSQDEIKYNSYLKKIFVKAWLEKILLEIRNNKAEDILDIGCGEGFPERFFLDREKNLKFVGVDVSREALKLAKNKNHEAIYRQGSVEGIKIRKKFDLVLMMEVLEHLKFPEKSLKKIKEIGTKVIFSVPFEPWFSIFSLLSGKYLKNLGKHPDHINFWSRKSFEDLLMKYFSEVKIIVSFPWLIAVCKK